MRFAVAGALLLLASCGPPADRRETPPFAAESRAFQLKAADGTMVFAREYLAERPRAVILLFHQAESSKGEYVAIAPRLVAMGYSVLAIDQRSGGGLYGVNETAARAKGSPTYLDALPDMQAAIDWGAAQRVPVILWGSSYSASLAFPLAVKNADVVKGLLAFSPAEYFGDETRVARAARKLTVPAYVTSSPAPDEVAAAKAIADAVPAGLVTRYVPRDGVHGSSTLLATKDPKGADTNWLPVAAFLKRVAP